MYDSEISFESVMHGYKLIYQWHEEAQTPLKPLNGGISTNIIYSAEALMLVTIDLQHNNEQIKKINNIYNSKC